MSAALLTVTYQGQMSSSASAISIGQAVCENTDGGLVPATTAARAAAGGVISGVAMTVADRSYVGLMVAQGGSIPAAVSGLAAGTASPVTVSATGALQRTATPVYGTDSVVGDCYANGDVVLSLGISQKSAPGGGTSIAGTTTLEANGAVGDGVTDDSAAFTAALAGGKTILLGAKTYLVSTGGTLQAGAAIVGVGDMSVLKTTGSSAVINIGGTSCVLKDFKILGVSGGSASQVGIQNGTATPASGYTNLRIAGVHCVNLGGHGFLMQNTDGSTTEVGPSISDCFAEGCGSNAGTPGAGFYAAAEYTNFSGCRATYNTGYAAGLQIAAGNVNWGDGQIVRNGIGIKINAGSNDAHGIVSGTEINHNNTSIDIDNISNGHTFIGCHIYSNQIWLRGSNGVRFIGCTIGTDIAFAASQNTKFHDCCFPTGSAVNLYQSYGGASTEEFVNCYDLAGNPFAATAGSTDTNLVKNYWAGRIQVAPPAGANYTELVSNLVARYITYVAGGGIAGAQAITYPTPLAAREYYEKSIYNNTGFALTFNCGGAGIVIATGKRAILGFDVAGEVRITADV